MTVAAQESLIQGQREGGSRNSDDNYLISYPVLFFVPHRNILNKRYGCVTLPQGQSPLMDVLERRQSVGDM